MTAADEWLRIESLDLDAQGVAHNAEGKVVFVDDALAGEEVRVVVRRRKKQWEQAGVVALRRESAQRVVPRCRHFGVCGGCKMQHLHVAAQVATKQRALEDALWHLGKVRAGQLLRPLEGPAWRYRHRARLSVRHVAKKGTVLVGFHERKSSFVADIVSCEVLPRHVSDLLLPLRELVGAMATRDRIPQIELAVGDDTTALVLRHLEPLPPEDLARLRDFAALHGIEWWLQAKGPDTARRLDRNESTLAYSLPEFGVRMPFRPTDFTQVNHQVNEALVSRAVRLLAPGPDERVVDWFCGLGNFSLPLATRSGSVLGVEGSPALVERAGQAAALNGLSAKTEFAVRNLFDVDAVQLAGFGAADKWLVDPPREGAFAIAKALVDCVETPGEWSPPERIVYVSCNPATLARDAGLLVHRGGYRLAAAGVVNMFPHTAHVESIAVFERAKETGPEGPG
ncbi:MAG TPA: 23S rRNA (uracil(1939)-C(5))-methyltransferase RlmD [Caldimonas sp.]|jgi:23S rRNA (uracil1939-C5)-methyltransferase|nr:23S rRNA (uracil(1939)-C(5))-methyltransferase RlmD [Caldimonas sp.]HEX2540579.1 23S rRNA (uracil(1939)-C(5))-methyltransferase RlmD [Caldimonas sp.]